MKKLSFKLSILCLLIMVNCQKKSTNEPPANNIHPQVDIPWPSLADSPWPMHLQNPQSTGRSPHTGPQKGNIKWSFKPGGTIISTVLIGPDSSIIFPYLIWGEESGLYSLSRDGEINWQLKIRLGSISHPLITSSGTIFIVGGVPFHSVELNSIYEISLAGEILNRYDLDFEPSPYLNIGINGNLIFTNESTLYKFSPNGNIESSGNVPYNFYYQKLALSIDGHTAYLFNYLKYHNISGLNAFSADNNQSEWILNINGDQHADQSPIVDSYGNIYIGTFGTSDSIGCSAISADGELQWKYPARVNSNVTIDRNGCLYFVDSANGGHLVSLDPSGKLRWETECEADLAPLICDNEGRIYLCSSTGISSFNSNGEFLWKAAYHASATRVTCPAIGYNSELYVGTFGSPLVESYLFAIE